MLKSKHIESNRENSVFQLFFLLNNENQDIEVVEVEEIDFTEVKKRLEKENQFSSHVNATKKLNRSQLLAKKVKTHSILLIYEEKKHG